MNILIVKMSKYSNLKMQLVFFFFKSSCFFFLYLLKRIKPKIFVKYSNVELYCYKIKVSFKLIIAMKKS